jgi:hypothetical protein
MSERPWVIRQLEPYIYTQSVPMETVVINHNKGRLHPTTTLVMDDGTPFEALIEAIDDNSIVIKLNLAVTFTAYIY